jgi:hypothetical protein
MRTKLIFLSIVVFFVSENFSQSKFNVGASFNIGNPIGDFYDIAKTAIGGSINSEYVFSDNISATFAVYYYSYSSKIPTIAIDGSTFDFSVEAIPVILGLKYFHNKSFFGTVEAGVHIMRVKADVYLGDNLSTDFETKFGAGFGLGYRIQLAEASLVEVTGVYQYVQDDLSSISLRATILVLLGNL